MATVRKGDILELTIDKMAFGGMGIGRRDGFVIFVRGAIPGDKIAARVYKKRKGHAEANLIEILSPSPDRIDTPCAYSGYCGGCQWQHVRYERQLFYKREHIKDALERIGGVHPKAVFEPIPAKDTFGYRNKMEFSFSDRPWLLPEEMEAQLPRPEFALGLHVPGTFNKVIDIEACLLHPFAGNPILTKTREYVKKSGIPVYGLKSHQGFWRFLTLRYSFSMNEWMLNFVTSEYDPDVVAPLAETLNNHFGSIGTIVNNISRRKAAVAVGQREYVLSGKGVIQDNIGQFLFTISPNSFFQTNPDVAKTLYDVVVQYAELNKNDTVLDLYSGTGTIPIYLSDRVKTITGIEINEHAVSDAENNCAENQIENCHFICGDIRNTLAHLNKKPDVIIIDPPRAGMHGDVTAKVLSFAAPKIIYISCNPATMARDIGLLCPSYELARVQPVDMFPQTSHIEAVAELNIRKKYSGVLE